MSVYERFSKSPFIQQDWGKEWARILILPTDSMVTKAVSHRQ